jgi:hypothetical protein
MPLAAPKSSDATSWREVKSVKSINPLRKRGRTGEAENVPQQLHARGGILLITVKSSFEEIKTTTHHAGRVSVEPMQSLSVRAMQIPHHATPSCYTNNAMPLDAADSESIVIQSPDYSNHRINIFCAPSRLAA